MSQSLPTADGRSSTPVASARQRSKFEDSALVRRYSHWSLRTKILSIVAQFSLVTVVVAAVAVLAIQAALADTQSMASLSSEVDEHLDAVAEIQAQAKLDVAVAAVSAALGAFPASELAEQNAATDAAFAQAVADYEAGVAGLGEHADALAKENWQTFVAGWNEWLAMRDGQMMPALRSGDFASLGVIVATSEALSAQVDESYAAEDDLLDAASAQLTEHSNEEAATATMFAVGVGVVGIGLVVIAALGATSFLRRELEDVERVAHALSRGDFTHSSGLDARDEIGRVARSLDAASANLRETMAGVADASRSVAASSRQLSSGNARVTAGAQEVSQQASQVATAASEVSRNLGDVSRGSGEMSSSISEIASSTAEAARVARQAADAAEAADGQIQRLGASSQEIGDVVKAITQIAAQTNLLALNATIEAARAGEAGKGFAVVAGEVGELARETARATEDIARRVEAIQADAGGAVTAIAQIAQIVASINESQATIAAAIEEQTATTNEIGRNVGDAASGSQEIASGIDAVAAAAMSSSQVMSETSEAVAELDRLAEDLRHRVSAFSF